MATSHVALTEDRTTSTLATMLGKLDKAVK